MTDATHICRDRYTRREIARGTFEAMDAFRAAFGLCYIEPAPEPAPELAQKPAPRRFRLFGFA